MDGSGMDGGRDGRDDGLAPFFVAARARDAERGVPAPLMERILSDARDAVPASPRRVAAPAGPGMLETIAAALGGWGGVAAFAACAAAGFWIGTSDLSDAGSDLMWPSGAGATVEDPVASFYDLAAAEV